MIILPRLTSSRPEAIAAWAHRLVDALDTVLAEIGAPAGSGPYVVTNPAPARSLDVAAATLGQVRAVLGTVIADLKQKGDIA